MPNRQLYREIRQQKLYRKPHKAEEELVAPHKGNNLVQLQRTLGNRAVQHLMAQGRINQHAVSTSHGFIQPKFEDEQLGAREAQYDKIPLLSKQVGMSPLQRCSCGGKCKACQQAASFQQPEEQYGVSDLQRSMVIQRFWGDEEEEDDGGSWYDSVVETVSDTASDVAEWGSETASDAWDAASETASDVAEWGSETASDAWDAASETASDVAEWGSETAGEVWDTVTDTASDVAEWGTEKASEAWDSAKETASDAAEWGEEKANEAWQTLIQTFGDPNAAINSAIGVVQHALSLYTQISSNLGGLPSEHQGHVANLQAAQGNLAGLLGSDNYGLILGAVQPILGAANQLTGVTVSTAPEPASESSSDGTIQRTAAALPLAGAGPIGWVILAMIAIAAVVVLASTKKPCKPCSAPQPCRVDRVDPPGKSRKHFPCPGDHYHYYVMNQNPVTCDCFEREGGTGCLPPGGIPSDPPCSSYVENWG